MKKVSMILFFLLFQISFTSFADDTVYFQKDGTKIGFSIIKFKIGSPVEGKFNEFFGQAEYDEDDKELKDIQFTIFAPSIDTGNKKRDKHLRTDDFFNVLKYPAITFTSKKEVKLEKKFTLEGTLTMRGVSKKIQLSMETIKAEDEKVVLRGTAKINRLDFGVSWNKNLEKGDWKKVFGVLGKTVLDDTVTLQLDLTASVFKK